METKRNIKYFTSPPISIPALIGWGIALIGVILLSARSLRLWGVIVIIVGIVLVVATSGRKSTDTDIEFQISERIRNLQELNEKKFEVYEKNFLKMLRPVSLRGYDFVKKEEPFYYRKGNDGQHRTNYFTGVNLIFTGEKVFIYGRRFSLTDESIDETFTASYFYNELSRATLEDYTYPTKVGKRDIEVPYSIFTIEKADGTPALEMCVDRGADVEKYADQISRAIGTRQKELEKRAEETAKRRAAFRAQVEAQKAALAAEEAAKEATAEEAGDAE